MEIAVIAALLGLVIAVACIQLPKLASRHNAPYSQADAREYEKETGRSMQEIEDDNAAERAQQEDRVRADQPDTSDGGR
jgi:hypothetical protein